MVLTALSSWAGAREIRGGALTLLTTAWLAPVLPVGIVAGCDSLMFLLLAVMVTPDLVMDGFEYHLADA